MRSAAWCEYGAGRVAVGCGVDEDDVAGVLERLQEDKAARPAVKTLHACRQRVLFESSHHVYAHAFITHDDIAEAEHECLIGVHQILSLMHGANRSGVCGPPLEPAGR